MRIFSVGFAVAMLALVVFGATANAQTTSIPFGIINHDSSQPIEIVADSFTISQNKGQAEFVGNVVVGQAEMRMTAARILVEYDSVQDQKAGKIARMVASGGVTLVSGSEAAEAKNAVYSIKDNMIRLDGDVLLTQGTNALSGQKMTINLSDGSASIEGRVKTIFRTGGSE